MSASGACCAGCAASWGVRRSMDPAARAAAPRIVVLLDGYGGFASEHGDIGGDALREALARVWADGPELGIHLAIAADRLGAVPTALASLAQQRLAFQLADVADYAQFGLMRRAIPQFVPGRAVVGGSAQVIQVARADPARSLAEEVAARAERVAGATPAEGGPPPVGVLPESVGIDALLGAGRAERDPLFIPFGIGDETLEPAGLRALRGRPRDDRRTRPDRAHHGAAGGGRGACAPVSGHPTGGHCHPSLGPARVRGTDPGGHRRRGAGRARHRAARRRAAARAARRRRRCGGRSHSRA